MWFPSDRKADKQPALKEEKEKTLETMRKLSRLYTSEDSTADLKKLNKYLLRGVSTKKDVTYICRRAEPDLIEMDLDSESPKLPSDQWWRCAFLIEKGVPRVSVEVGFQVECIWNEEWLTTFRKHPRKKSCMLRNMKPTSKFFLCMPVRPHYRRRFYHFLLFLRYAQHLIMITIKVLI